MFEKARQSAFISSQPTVARFLDWMCQASPDSAETIAKLKSFSVEILVYLAKETVAQMVDVALLLRRDVNMCPADPFSRVSHHFPSDASLSSNKLVNTVI